ncbi:MAG: sensor domain-containing diguanylate cyclase [Geminicoccaceae bacterium]|nr:MAG: sensor domain-containing diguanylate cyclase [Geminicoccaceae bacterium]
MLPAPSSPNAGAPPERELERLMALRRYHILDTPPESAFDRITALAARLLRTPVAIVGFVDAERVWFKSHYGLAIDQVERAPGLCGSAVMSDGPYVVTDARNDPRTRDNPMVMQEDGVGFYAGVPLRTEDGFVLGTLCVLDYAPRQIDGEGLATLQALADLVVDQLELRVAARQVDALSRELLAVNERLRQQATHDDLTGLWNRRRVLEHLDQQLALARRQERCLAVLLIDLDRFKAVNDRHGHAAGDRALIEVARRLRAVCRAGEAVGRLGGEEFLAVFFGCNREQAVRAAERLRRTVADVAVELGDAGPTVALSISGGLALDDGTSAVETILRRADAALYRAKALGRNRIELDASLELAERT